MLRSSASFLLMIYQKSVHDTPFPKGKNSEKQIPFFFKCLSWQVACKVPKIPSEKIFVPESFGGKFSILHLTFFENPKKFKQENHLRVMSILSSEYGADLAVLGLFSVASLLKDQF